MLWTVSRRTGLLVGMLALVLAGGLQTEAPRPQSGAEPAAAMKARVQATFGQLPLYFIENRGQVDKRVAYYVQGKDTTLYFTPQGVTFALTGPGPHQPAPDKSVHRAAWRSGAVRPTPGQESARQRWAVKVEFVGANHDVTPTGQDLTPAVVSYFKGPQDQWQTGLKTYATLVYPDLWPGIDLIYTGTASRLKATFVVKPGADPSQIQLAYRGATAVQLTEAGQLEVETPVGSFSDDRPYAYQEGEGWRVAVPVAYTLDTGTAAGAAVYGFRVGAYDPSQPLVLDPAVLVYAGYIGGELDDVGLGIAVDDEGNAYVTGFTSSTEATFPVTGGPDLTFNGGIDAFVAKVNAAGTALVYAGYIGGSGFDEGRGIAVDDEGNAYVTGFTSSTEATFPVMVGPDLTFNGGGDAFVAKVNAAGTALVYAGYIGGSGGFDVGVGIAVDSAGAAYVTGRTDSTEATFPVTVGPDLTFNGGFFDAFVAKVAASANAPPTANAGPDQTVNEGATVTLDGRGSSDADGDPLAFDWTQTAGPAVTLNGATTATPTFTAPQVDAETILTFQLIVNDGQADSAPDTVNITVRNRGKRGGSRSSHMVDEATREIFYQLQTLAGQGHSFNKIVQAQFTLQTFERLPMGTDVLEPTALTGGQATLWLTATEDPTRVSLRLLRLRLEGHEFSFRPRIKAITGTLDLRTGAFHLTLSFRRLRTPETPQPFTWDGTAEGVYDFALGVVSLTEVGQGTFLAQ